MASEPVSPQYPSPPRIVDKTIPLDQANLYGLVLGPVLALLIIVPFSLRWGWIATWTGLRDFLSPIYIFILVFIASILIHEGLHALGWGLIGRTGWKNMEFGIQSLTPYAHCTVAMPARAYRIGAALPGLVLGVVPGIVSFFNGSGWLMVYGAFMLLAAAGDVMVLWLLRGVPASALVQDHPSEAGCQVILD